VYAVDIDEASWRRFERTAPRNVVEVARQVLSGFLTEHPEDRIAAAGRLKRLKGRQAGLLQYDLPSFLPSDLSGRSRAPARHGRIHRRPSELVTDRPRLDRFPFQSSPAGD
jgi:hypothetical protein